MRFILLSLISFSLHAGIIEDFQKSIGPQSAETINQFEAMSKKDSPCMKDGDYIVCAIELAKATNTKSTIQFHTLIQLIEMSADKDMKKFAKCEDDCRYTYNLLAHAAKLELLRNIKGEMFSVRSWVKTLPPKTPGALYVQFNEEANFFLAVQDYIEKSVTFFTEAKVSPKTPADLKPGADGVIQDFKNIDLSVAFKGGVLLDEKISSESLIADYQASQGKEEANKHVATIPKLLSVVRHKPQLQADYPSKYAQYVAKEVARFTEWKETTVKSCPLGQPLPDCFTAYLEKNRPMTTAGLGLALTISMGLIIKESNSPAKIVEHLDNLASGTKMAKLPVALLRQKNAGKHGTLALQAIEEVGAGELFLEANQQLQNSFAKKLLKPDLKAEDKTMLEQALQKLKASNYKPAFEGSLILDPAITPAMIEADYKNVPESKESRDKLIESFVALRGRFKS